MNTKVEQIEASAPEWPQRDTADLVDLIHRLLDAADGLSSHSNEPREAWAYPPETPWPAQVRDSLRYGDRISRFGDTDQGNADPPAPSRGMVAGLFLSVPLWALIGVGVWFLV
jgi:hypothetical protein